MVEDVEISNSLHGQEWKEGGGGAAVFTSRPDPADSNSRDSSLDLTPRNFHCSPGAPLWNPSLNTGTFGKHSVPTIAE